MAIRIYVLIITLNVNRLNTPTKRQTGRKDQPQEKKKKNAQSTNMWRLNMLLRNQWIIEYQRVDFTKPRDK